MFPGWFHQGSRDYVEHKVQMWTKCAEKPTIIAGPQSQAVNAVLTKSFQLEWAYLR